MGCCQNSCRCFRNGDGERDERRIMTKEMIEQIIDAGLYTFRNEENRDKCSFCGNENDVYICTGYRKKEEENDEDAVQFEICGKCLLTLHNKRKTHDMRRYSGRKRTS